MIFNDDMPLKEKKVVVTRAHSQQGPGFELFSQLGATVLELPALVIGPPDKWQPLDEALSQLESFQWLIFSSANGVKFVEDRLQLKGKSLAGSPKNLKIAAVGRKTAIELENIGAIPDFVPVEFIADSLIENFPHIEVGKRILLPRVQSGGRTIIAESFAQTGVHVLEVAAYESRCPDSIPKETLNALIRSEVDVLTFTSSKIAANTAKLMRKSFGSDWGKKLCKVKLISIGPQTSMSCKKYFGRVDSEANPHDLDGLVEACIQAVKEESP